MSAVNKAKVYAYLDEHHPDVLLLNESDFTMEYVHSKASLLNENSDADVSEIMQELQPSKFAYVKDVLEEEFPNAFEMFLSAGILKYEVVNIIEDAKEAFETVPLTTETEDSRLLRYHVIGAIAEYLEK